MPTSTITNLPSEILSLIFSFLVAKGYLTTWRCELPDPTSNSKSNTGNDVDAVLHNHTTTKSGKSQNIRIRSTLCLVCREWSHIIRDDLRKYVRFYRCSHRAPYDPIAWFTFNWVPSSQQQQQLADSSSTRPSYLSFFEMKALAQEWNAKMVAMAEEEEAEEEEILDAALSGEVSLKEQYLSGEDDKPLISDPSFVIDCPLLYGIRFFTCAATGLPDISRCRQLEVLMFHNCEMTMQWLHNTLTHLTQLRFISIDVSNVILDDLAITASAATATERTDHHHHEPIVAGAIHKDNTFIDLSHCSMLESIHICRVDDDWIKRNIADRSDQLSRLQTLQLPRCKRVNKPCFGPVVSYSLRELLLPQCGIIDEWLQDCSRHHLLPSLHSLTLRDCQSLVRPTVPFANLRRLDLSNCRHLESVDLSACARNLEELEINAAVISDSWVAENFGLLATTSCNGDNNVNQNETKFPRLRLLVFGSELAPHYACLSLSHLDLRSLHSLQELHLGHCRNVRTLQLSNRARSSTLQSLDLENVVPLVTDEWIKSNFFCFSESSSSSSPPPLPSSTWPASSTPTTVPVATTTTTTPMNNSFYWGALKKLNLAHCEALARVEMDLGHCAPQLESIVLDRCANLESVVINRSSSNNHNSAATTASTNTVVSLLSCRKLSQVLTDPSSVTTHTSSSSSSLS